jgi:hypothetical protein
MKEQVGSRVTNVLQWFNYSRYIIQVVLNRISVTGNINSCIKPWCCSKRHCIIFCPVQQITKELRACQEAVKAEKAGQKMDHAVPFKAMSLPLYTFVTRFSLFGCVHKAKDCYHEVKYHSVSTETKWRFRFIGEWFQSHA